MLHCRVQTLRGRKRAAATLERPPQRSKFKTEMCRNFSTSGQCRYGDKCQFAHGLNDLRARQLPPQYKTRICRTFSQSGRCPYGSKCRFIHGNENDLMAMQLHEEMLALGLTSEQATAAMPWAARLSELAKQELMAMTMQQLVETKQLPPFHMTPGCPPLPPGQPPLPPTPHPPIPRSHLALVPSAVNEALISHGQTSLFDDDMVCSSRYPGGTRGSSLGNFPLTFSDASLADSIISSAATRDGRSSVEQSSPTAPRHSFLGEEWSKEWRGNPTDSLTSCAGDLSSRDTDNCADLMRELECLFN
ncbi:MAG: hypothetical protein SGPRY_003170 [Prymnesium sp.]